MPQILPTKLQTKYIYNFVLKLRAGATEYCIFEILGFIRIDDDWLIFRYALLKSAVAWTGHGMGKWEGGCLLT